MLLCASLYFLTSLRRSGINILIKSVIITIMAITHFLAITGRIRFLKSQRNHRFGPVSVVG